MEQMAEHGEIVGSRDSGGEKQRAYGQGAE